ncbi:hypothetical protein GCM10011381_13960 [Klenkia taihuensis]|nr:hypothetical protein GCM10011381_13960 [Klenkia taihuensis]
MSNLRRKLTAAGLDPARVRTVRGVGYRLDRVTPGQHVYTAVAGTDVHP